MEPTLNPNPWIILPFGVLLAAIALAPLFFVDWWQKHYPTVAWILGAITVAYYLVGLNGRTRVWHGAVEYTSFIALIGSLFVVSGGIHINVKGEATPFANVGFLFVGALIANLFGTTGASMLLIRPWLRMNKYRITAHHVVFFIFIVSNVGGCLTPIGDPPLFLGYLQGIPFWWVAEHCWPIWAVALGVLLAMFYLIDRSNYLRAPKRVREKLAEPHDVWRFEGLANLFYLAVILGAVFIHDPPFLREIVMVAAAAGSYFTTRESVHQANRFNFHPIQEVAILFAGIFATMMPALDWLRVNAATLGNPTPALFYWSSGALSSVLDNAPTYLSFLNAGFGAFVDPDVVKQVQHLVQTQGADLASITGPHAEHIQLTFAALRRYHEADLLNKTVTETEIAICFLLGNLAYNKYILAISVGAVFFGANTYIGNGPNFMVKAIADQQKVRTPAFLGFVFKYTLPIMLPMLVIVWWIFFRG